MSWKQWKTGVWGGNLNIQQTSPKPHPELIKISEGQRAAAVSFSCLQKLNGKSRTEKKFVRMRICNFVQFEYWKSFDANGNKSLDLFDSSSFFHLYVLKIERLTEF
jgi:hypothetical protein